MVLAAAVAAVAIDGKELGTGSNFYWKSPKTKLLRRHMGTLVQREIMFDKD